MQWHEEILRDFAQKLDAAREIVRTNIESDLQSQGATPEHVIASLEGVDELFADSLRRGLSTFALTLVAELRDADETMH